MKNVSIKIWLGLCVVLPMLFGLFMLMNPQVVIDTNPPTALVQLVAIRQFVYGGVLLLAILYLPKPAVALLVAGRGATEFADAVASIVSTGGIAGPVLGALISSLISFLVAFALLPRSARRPGVVQPVS